MKVILQKNVENLGHIGEIKDVKRGYARNYLLPRKLVILANSSSIKAQNHQDFLIERKHAKHLIAMKSFAQKLSEIDSVTIEAPASPNEEDTKLYGSVTTTQIAELLKKKGLILDKRKIVLKERIQRIGEYQIPIHLAEDLNLKLHLIVVKQPPKPETKRTRMKPRHFQTPVVDNEEKEISTNTETESQETSAENVESTGNIETQVEATENQQTNTENTETENQSVNTENEISKPETNIETNTESSENSENPETNTETKTENQSANTDNNTTDIENSENPETNTETKTESQSANTDNTTDTESSSPNTSDENEVSPSEKIEI